MPDPELMITEEIQGQELITPPEQVYPKLQEILSFHKKRPFPEGTRFEWVPLSKGFPSGYEAKQNRGKKSGLRFLDAVYPSKNSSDLYQLFAVLPENR